MKGDWSARSRTQISGPEYSQSIAEEAGWPAATFDTASSSTSAAPPTSTISGSTCAGKSRHTRGRPVPRSMHTCGVYSLQRSDPHGTANPDRWRPREGGEGSEGMAVEHNAQRLYGDRCRACGGHEDAGTPQLQIMEYSPHRRLRARAARAGGLQ
jgi:hypothetical protein